MMKNRSKVYMLKIRNKENELNIYTRIIQFILNQKLLSFVSDHDYVAIKTHFGEQGTSGFVKPDFFKGLSSLFAKKKCYPFITETATLYTGRRSNGVEHLKLAYDHGFGFSNTKLPIVMADGLLGDEEVKVDIAGEIYQTVNIAALFKKIQAMILVSHFTGHIQTGFGAAIKNLGMGCASRKGKMEQHSSIRPEIITSTCTSCQDCVKWCPVDAISYENKKININYKKCYGCGQCLSVCRFDSVKYNWGKGGDQVQKSMAEYAYGVFKLLNEKILCINFLNKITKDCDCMQDSHNIIADDVGVLLSFDPVAIDSASIDLVNKITGGTFQELAFGINGKSQLEHCQKIGFGNTDYQLIKIDL